MVSVGVRGRLLLVSWLGLGLVPSVAQAQLTRGIVSGTVSDATGAVLPGVSVTLVNEQTGLGRATTTSETGFYRVPALEPGLYRVTVALDGFRPVEHAGVAVKTSEEATLDVTLALAPVAESVEVVAAPLAATLNKSNPTVGRTFGAREAVELPLSPDRDPYRLALLSPNVFAAPGASPISANGQRSRNNNFTLDGSDNNEVTITTATMRLAPEAVAEFQVQTNPYNVEFGRNTGAQINVITRSGTNTFSGQVYDYYRGSELNSRSNIEKANGLAEPARFNRNQVGAGVGGPVLRNRMFFYGFYQGDYGRSANTLGATVRVPTPAGHAALATAPLGPDQSQASRQAVLDRLSFLRQVYARNPAWRSVQLTQVNGVAIETAQTNLGRATPSDADSLLGRADVQLSPQDNLTLRYVRNTLVNANAYSNTDFGSVFAANEDVRDQNTAIGHTHVFGHTLLNEARLSHIRRDLRFPENDPDSPTATIGGFFTIGGTSQFPQGRLQDSFQFSDVLTHQRGRHALKGGVDLRFLSLDSLAAFDSKGTFAFNNLQDYVNNRAATFRQALQSSSFEATQWQMSFFVQDDFKVSPALTLNLGLRYENSTVPLGFFGATEPQVLASRVPGPLQRDNDNVAPRAGFAWSPSADSGVLGVLFGDGRGVLRGGYGIAYDVLFYNLLINAASNYPRVVNGEVSNAFDVYPNTLPVNGAAVFSPMATFRNVPEGSQSPMSHYWSLSHQRDLGWDTTIEVGYTGSLGRNGLTQMQGNPAALTADQAAAVRAAQNAFVIPSLQARREDPAIGSRILYATVGRSEYHALFARVDRRFANRLQFGAVYTLSRLMSDSDELLALPDIAGPSPQVPQDYARLDQEWSVSAFDRTHRAAVNWIYELPGYSSRALDLAFGGWRVAGVFQAQSGQPFTVQTGVDSNGNGGGGDRPNLVDASRIVPDPVTGNMRTFTAAGAFYVPLAANGTPLASSLGNGNLGRNTLRAAAWFNWDVSLAKRFRVAGAHAVTLRADVLNLFNQDNYGVPINAMNNLSFGQNVNNWGNRSVTLSAKYEF
jgi:hypothetical protein